MKHVMRQRPRNKDELVVEAFADRGSRNRDRRASHQRFLLYLLTR